MFKTSSLTFVSLEQTVQAKPRISRFRRTRAALGSRHSIPIQDKPPHFHTRTCDGLEYIATILLSSLALLPTLASADGIEAVGNNVSTLPNMWNDITLYLPYRNMGANGVIVITNIVTNTVLWTIGGAAVLAILIAGIHLVTSAGRAEEVTKARKIIFYAALGLFFVVMTGVIITFVAGYVDNVATCAGGVC